MVAVMAHSLRRHYPDQVRSAPSQVPSQPGPSAPVTPSFARPVMSVQRVGLVALSSAGHRCRGSSHCAACTSAVASRCVRLVARRALPAGHSGNAACSCEGPVRSAPVWLLLPGPACHCGRPDGRSRMWTDEVPFCSLRSFHRSEHGSRQWGTLPIAEKNTAPAAAKAKKNAVSEKA